MPNLRAAADQIVFQLEAAGLRAVLDESDLPGDGVVLTAPVLSARMGGCWTADWTAYVLVGNTGTQDELYASAELLPVALEVLGFTTAEPVEISSTDSGRRPGWKVTFQTRIN